MVARRCRICLELNPASIRIRVSSVSTYVQLPAEPLPKIVRRTATADIRDGCPRRQQVYVEKPEGRMLRVPPLHRSAAFRLQNRGQQEGVGKSRWGRQFEQFCSLKAALLCPEILRYVVTDEMRPAP